MIAYVLGPNQTEVVAVVGEKEGMGYETCLRVVFWVCKHLSVNYRGKWVVFGSDKLRLGPALLVFLSLFADNDIILLYFLTYTFI